MPISIPTFLSYLLLIGSAGAQIAAPNCTADPTLGWLSNSLQQSPCFVGASLQAVCNDGVFDVPSLLPGKLYVGPYVGQDNGCICNTVVYSLVSACSVCQNASASWVTYSTWTTNCSNATTGVFPKPVPSNIRVPHWAYLTSSIVESDKWNLTAAEAAGDNPEVTGTFNFSSTASGSGSSSTSTSHTNSNRGGMEGGVVGGVVSGALISGVVVWFVVRRRRTRCARSTTNTWSEIEQSVPDTDPLAIETLRLYDPLDPTTYPRRKFQPQRFGFTILQPSQLGYSGLPEV